MLLVALGIQHAMPMRHIVICDMSGSTTFFQIILQTARFSGNVIEYIKCVFIYSTDLSKIFLILRRIQRGIKNCILVPKQSARAYSCLILITLELSRHFRKIFKYQISRKSDQWEPICSMRTDGRTDGRTDITKLIVDSNNFERTPKNVSKLH